MKSIRYIALGAFLILGVFWVVLYSSCAKDACGGITCKNKSSCSRGLCQCPAGLSGAECEILYRNLYSFGYKGSSTGNLSYPDSNNKLIFMANSLDTVNYNTMNVTWDTGGIVYTLPIVLTANSATGSTFSVVPTYVTASNGVINKYTGSGSINATTASMDLTDSVSSGPSLYLHYTDFYRY